MIRLSRVEGQKRGIRRMVQGPSLCVEILQQLAAAEAAVNRVSLAILKYHVEKCVPEGIERGSRGGYASAGGCVLKSDIRA